MLQLPVVDRLFGHIFQKPQAIELTAARTNPKALTYLVRSPKEFSPVCRRPWSAGFLATICASDTCPWLARNAMLAQADAELGMSYVIGAIELD
jgi:hypothetical protein